jgi:hypothetical protein
MVSSSIVTIQGTGLSNVTYVSVGSRRIFVRGSSDSQITFDSPASLFSGATDISLTTPWETIVRSNAITYSEIPTITISSFNPISGIASGGSEITINGSGFLTQNGYCNGICGAGYGYVKFGNAYASVTSFTNTVLKVNLPQNAGLGNVDLVVGNFWGTAKAVSKFSYTAAAHPFVSSISPSIGTALGGTPITITGTNLGSVQSVMFGDLYANIQNISDTRILLAAPTSLVVGVVGLKVSNLWETLDSGKLYTFTAPPAPVITSVSPDSGTVAGGNTVVITGTGFTTPNGYGCWGCGSGYGYVKFGNTYAGVRSYTDTQITVVAPEKSTTGQVDITVGNAWSSISASNSYTYTASPTPTITSLSSTSLSATGGSSITLTGTNFYGINAIYIGKSYVNFTVNSPTQILLNPGILGQIGLQDFSVVTRWATVTKNQYVTVTAPVAPTITSVSPNSGPATGGTQITIRGKNFTPVYDYTCWGCLGYNYVTIGGNFAKVTSYTDTEIVATIPQGSVVGIVDVAVSTSWTQTKFVGGFTYTAPPQPTISSVSPSSGSITGGTVVTLTGTGLLASKYSIRVGNNWSYGIPVDDTSLTFKVPVGSTTGLQDITLMNQWSTTTLPGAYTYTLAAAPVISGVSPTNGTALGGFEITVTGSGLNSLYGYSTDCISCLGFNTLFVGETPVTVTRYSDTELVATVPQIKQVGNISVSIRNSWTTVTSPAAIQLTKPADVQLISLSPINVDAAGGYAITLNGAHMSIVSSIFIGDSQVKFAVISENQIIAYSPYSPTNSSVSVRISSLWSSSLLANALTFTGGRPVPPEGQIGLSINAGDRFTGSRNVKLNLVWPAGATTAYVSNDGGFSNPLTLVKNLQTEVDWQLDPPGVVPLPALVYVRYAFNGSTYFDDIIIDSVAPILTSASATS